MTGIDRRSVLLGALGAAGAALTGCSAPSPSPAPSSAASRTPTASASTPIVPDVPRWPLTGRPLTDPAAARRAVVAVKVPDNKNEHPQVGINDADVVFVELEGYPDALGQSATRLVPVFHSTYAPAVAPVRSMRPVDVPLLSPMSGVIGSTGASGWVVNYIASFSEFVDGDHTYMASKATGSYSLDQSRVRTYQGKKYYDRAVVCHPEALAKQPTRFASGPSRLYFPFARTDAEVSTASGRPAPTVRVPWKKGSTYDMVYTWDAKSSTYLRSMPWGPHVLADKARVTTDNILVIRATQRTAKLFDGDGEADPVHDIINSNGTFVYAHGGTYVTGTWTKGAVQEPFAFVLDDGRPLAMAPGRTFVELPKLDADVRFV